MAVEFPDIPVMTPGEVHVPPAVVVMPTVACETIDAVVPDPVARTVPWASYHHNPAVIVAPVFGFIAPVAPSVALLASVVELPTRLVQVSVVLATVVEKMPQPSTRKAHPARSDPGGI